MKSLCLCGWFHLKTSYSLSDHLLKMDEDFLLRTLHHLGNSQPQVCSRTGLQAWICQDCWQPHPHHLQRLGGGLPGQVRHHLCGGPHPRDFVRWTQLQVCLQLPVAFQAEHPCWWVEEEGQPLRRGW